MTGLWFGRPNGRHDLVGTVKGRLNGQTDIDEPLLQRGQGRNLIRRDPGSGFNPAQHPADPDKSFHSAVKKQHGQDHGNKGA